MRLAGRVSAAIDVLTDIFERHRPASEALKDWGKANGVAVDVIAIDPGSPDAT